MNYTHKQLAAGRWFNLSFCRQMANIGGEVSRATSWRDKNSAYSRQALFRALELLSLTLDDKKTRQGYPRLKELCRLKEALLDFFWGDNRFSSSDSLFDNYFLAFAYAARRGR